MTWDLNQQNKQINTESFAYLELWFWYILAGSRGEGDGPDENGDTELKEENGNGTVKKEIKEENGHGDGKDDQNGHTNGDSKQNGNNSEKEEIKEEVFRKKKRYEPWHVISNNVAF